MIIPSLLNHQGAWYVLHRVSCLPVNKHPLEFYFNTATGASAEKRENCAAPLLTAIDDSRRTLALDILLRAAASIAPMSF